MSTGERQIKISITGDASGLDKTVAAAEKDLTSVSERTDQVATKAGTATGALGALAGGLGAVGLGPFAGALQSVAIATDVASGAADLATLALESQRVKTIGATAATIAHTVAQKACAAASKLWAGAQAALNIVLDASPILLVVAAIATLVAAIVYIATQTDLFQKLWDAAWSGIKTAVSAVVDFFTQTIPAAFGAVIDWCKQHWPLLLGILTGPIGLAVVEIIKHWDSIVAFVKSLPGIIGKAGAHLWDWVVSGFKIAINGLIGVLNSAIGFINTKLIDTANKIPFVNIPHIPSIPRLAQGGLIKARPGGTLAVIGEGGEDEVVAPLSKLAGNIEVHVYIGDEEITDIVRTEIADQTHQTIRAVGAGAGRRGLAPALAVTG